MHYKILFRIEKYALLEKLIHKIRNYKKYCDEVGDTCEIEVVFAGDVVKHFSDFGKRNLSEDCLSRSVLSETKLSESKLCRSDSSENHSNENHRNHLIDELVHTDLDLALCHNALSGCNMADINKSNIRTVRAGIGEIITKKAQGYIEYTIE